MNTLVASKSDKKSSGLIYQCEQWMDTGRFYLKKHWISANADHLVEFQRLVSETGSHALEACKKSIANVKEAVADRMNEPLADLGLENRFYAELLGISKVKAMSLNEDEANIILELEKIMVSGRVIYHLPFFPASTPKLLKALRRDDIAPWPEFRKQLDHDPLMKNRFFKATGSNPSYLKLPVSKDGLRKMLLQISVEMVIDFDKDLFGMTIREKLATQSLNTAVAACSLAKDGYGEDTEAWMTGLVHNIAVVTLTRQLRKFDFDFEAIISIDFLNEIANMVALLSHRICQAWKLPNSVAKAVKEQATIGLNSKLSLLGEGLYLASRLAMLHKLSIENSDDINEQIKKFSGPDRLTICESAYACINEI